MCFQKKTTIIKSGLGDAQYAQLQGNQGTLGENVAAGFTGAGTRFNTVDSGIGDIKTGISGITNDVNTNTNTRFDTLGNTLSGYADANNNRFDQFDRNFASNTAAVGANNAALNTLQGDVTGGFNDQASRFNTVDAANTAMQGTVDQGFVDQAQGFSDAQISRDANNTANVQGFADTGAALTTGFGDAATQRGEATEDVLAGQASAATNLDALNTGFNSYAAQDATDQAAMKATQDGFVSSFDTYADRYTEDTNLANKTRADMQLANSNANIRLREDIGEFADASSSQLSNVAQGVGNQIQALEGTVEGGFSANTNAASALKTSLDSTMDNVDAAQIVAARDMAKVVASQTDLSMDIRQNFTQLGNAFDDTGNLIESSIDEQGNTIARSMDEQGNLILNRFDVSGQGLGQKSININTTLEQLGNLGNRAGSNASMGNLSPASSAAVPQTGFASSFAETR